MPQNNHRLAPLLSRFAGIFPVFSEGAVHSFVLPVGARPPALATLVGHGLTVVVTPTGRAAEQLATDLGAYVGGVQVFPAWETLPHEKLSPRLDTMARRIAALYQVNNYAAPAARGDAKSLENVRAATSGSEGAHATSVGARSVALEKTTPHTLDRTVNVLVVPLRALLQPVQADLPARHPVVLRPGDAADMQQVLAELVQMGYVRTDLVERRGEVAVRGGILDVFAPTDPRPLRVEFFGDEVEDVRSFAVSDQRTVADADELWAPACRELLLTPEIRQKATRLQNDFPGFAELLEKMAQGMYAEGMEVLAPALVERRLLPELLPPATYVFWDPERLESRAADLISMSQEFMSSAWSAAAGGGNVPFDAGAEAFATIDQCVEKMRGPLLNFTALPSPDALDLGFAPAPEFRGNIAAAKTQIDAWIHVGTQVLVTGAATRLAARLNENGIITRVCEDARPGSDLVVQAVPAPAAEGFVGRGIAVVTEANLTGKARSIRPVVPAKRKKGVDPLALRRGDYIVHERHGVGQFIELATRTTGRGADAVTREYLVAEYAPTRKGRPADRLWIPTDALDQVSKYTGGETPTLSKMGGADWEKAKQKARKATREIAAELLRLYAARQSAKGYAFSPDTPWQAELEENFAHIETPDQLTVIDEIKADMEKPVPMDRLLSGDVGFGKTEVAVRAAFKAVQDSKQVAVLVPTTLLVQQHLETFTDRYLGFPVTVAALSRFTGKKEAEEIKVGLAAGKIDIVIGTHSLVTGQVRFKDLGLVIIDEEQRFGVEHKETLKQLRTNVDVLSMSATPIPRTLEMAVTGIRELSTLSTPPEERHPILTYVGKYSPAQVKAAIKRELLRDGQVFFVHNRVETIQKVAAQLAELVPEARIGTAHGKMGEHQLEQVIMDFWNRELDVLVCTTIVETGLDISNANTLIVDRADRMGLSQLHQLRGRVGRGRERAYAYFLYPADKVLTETAHERLTTIAANTDLGAGTAVAMKDLEIRGAGNLLGGQQSGHIAGIGFDLYVRMIAEAVAEFRGEDSGPKEDVKIEIPIDAHVPDTYVAGEKLRMEIYAKLSATQTEKDRAALAEELQDRYGPLPPPLTRLFAVSKLRERARQVGITEIAAQGKYLRFAPVELADSQMLRMRRLHPGTIQKLALRQILVPAPTQGKGGGKLGGGRVVGVDLIDWIEDVLVLLTTKPGQ
ncbi:MAG: transcription-repair coupling factor [Actinomycetaceae bacterium]|nr:transcription-repair coupling factor [Actinomycetaceae bacterium]